MPTPTPFFAVAPSAFAPFMREQIEVHTNDASKTVRASVLLNQKDTNTFADTFGDVFGVSFMRSDWGSDNLPSKGAIIQFGHPARRLFVVQVQPVNDVVHIVAVENASPGF